MKLAEALILRADYKKRIEQLKQRLLASAKVQEGDQPSEDPQSLLAELEQVSGSLLFIIQKINKTNSATEFRQGATLADILAERDVLSIRMNAYRDLARHAAVTQDRYTRTEVKFKSTVSIAEVQKKADDLSREYRELDSRVQESNWKTELMD
jgi:hypothetical protein